MAEKKRLLSVRVDELSLVDRPAVSKATFLIAKRAPQQKELTLDVLEKRIATQGYTSSASGSTSPAHVHDYHLYLDVEDGMVRVGGWVNECCDHTHRLTLEAYQRGETEASDGHIHTLMTIKEAREVMAKGMPQEEPAEVELTPEDTARISAMLATIGAGV